ncbi:hypothetical protein D9M70_468180 [compost metagenome]
MLRQVRTAPHRRAELLAMAQVQPLIGKVDAGVGEVGQVAAGAGQVGLAGQVAPDDAHLLAPAEAPQAAAQFVLVGAVGQQPFQLGAQFAAPQVALQLTAGGQFEKHLRIARDLLGDEVAAGGDAGEVGMPFVGPAFESGPEILRKIGDGGLEILPGALGERLESGRQRGQGRQGHGLS